MTGRGKGGLGIGNSDPFPYMVGSAIAMAADFFYPPAPIYGPERPPIGPQLPEDQDDIPLAILYGNPAPIPAPFSAPLPPAFLGYPAPEIIDLTEPEIIDLT
jgi:hypothetical protein